MTEPPPTTAPASVICFSTADWDAPLWTNKQHLMSRLGEKGVRVLYLDSLGLRAPGLSRSDLGRMARRLVGWRPFAVSTAPGVHRDGPLVIPLHRFARVRDLNRRLLAMRLRRNERRLALTRPVIWAYTPAAAEAYRPDRHRALVYHCVDDLAVYPGIDPVSFREGEAQLARRATVCIASSRPLVQHLEDLGAREVLYWPNPADTQAYRRAAEGRRPPAEGQRPVIGFIGAVQEHKVDVALLAEVARARPQWRFVLAGPVGLGLRETTIGAASFPDNVEMPGLVERADLPSLVASFDVGLIPYVQNAYTRGVFPMKVFEYLGAGLPVVATPLPALVGEVDHVAFAGDATAFIAAIEDALRVDAAGRHARSVYAEGFSWSRRTDQAIELLESFGR
jgi:glycosyltransferase involved in cell wall biosynthesis